MFDIYTTEVFVKSSYQMKNPPSNETQVKNFLYFLFLALKEGCDSLDLMVWDLKNGKDWINLN